MTNITRTGIHPPRGREAVMTTTALEFADEDRNNLRNIKKSNDEILTIFQILSKNIANALPVNSP